MFRSVPAQRTKVSRGPRKGPEQQGVTKMMMGPICKPNAHANSAAASGDVFGFGAAGADMQQMQNMMTMFAAPWAAMWAIQSELAQETLRRAFGG